MSSTLRSPAIRQLLRRPIHNVPQRRWAQVQHVRLLTNHGVDERVLAKYRAKLESKAKEAGVSDVSQLKEVYKEKIEELRKQAAVPGATAPLKPTPTPAANASSTPASNSSQAPASPWPAPPPPPKPVDTSKPPPGVKTLDSFLDMTKVPALPAKEIEALWRLRHANNTQSIHFALPAQTYFKLLLSSRKHPSFVLPLPREIPAEDAPEGSTETKQAAELHYLQFSHPHTHTMTLLLTSLAEFKLRGEFASPHTTITFHSELADSHDLVLGQGQVMEGRGISVDEARLLVMYMQKFYVVDAAGKSRAELLDMFTRGDAGFSVERLLEEVEKIV